LTAIQIGSSVRLAGKEVQIGEEIFEASSSVAQPTSQGKTAAKRSLAGGDAEEDQPKTKKVKQKRVFTVVFGQITGKVLKTYHEDGTLEWDGVQATLKDESGK